MVEPVESPCVNVCRLDAKRVCTGCGRTIDEIAQWRAMSDAERRAVVEAASKRREAASESD